MVDNLSKDALAAANDAKAAALTFGQAHWTWIAGAALLLGLVVGHFA
ncbi:MAG TPA: hypothetical protein VFB13_17915 [Reyranella sp.]|nr:hypothetical protein [Reyranella sp.]